MLVYDSYVEHARGFIEPALFTLTRAHVGNSIFFMLQAHTNNTNKYTTQMREDSIFFQHIQSE